MSLPTTHPEVTATAGKTCPVTGKSHEFLAPTAGDVRSVCPAINAMANHGYIPRDGKNITPFAIYRGLKACYGLSSPLSAFLTLGGWFLIKRYFLTRISLYDLGLHGGVEHDASVVHLNCPPGQKDAPVQVQPALVEDFARNVEADVVVTVHDIVMTRIRREKESKPLDAVHAEIARGEMAIILGVWNKPAPATATEGAPLSWMRRWLGEERLPDGWRPDHVQTMRDVVKRASAMRAEMKKLRAAEAAGLSKGQ
ncbi:Chloroperoxidase [Mycena epipterygia]|nr:Chloroperoxidase [Mycena epipterygia]